MKKIPFLLLEIITVVVLITVLAVLGIDKYHKIFNNSPKYSITFKDADGLSVGSPVRFAGVHIGHIVKLELKNNEIEITFKITKKNMEIPKGAVAGIEFTGLVGSKSLEIMPPGAKTENDQNLYKTEPLRINSFMEIQNAISKATLDFFNGILSFLNQNEKDARTNLKNAAKTFKKQSASLEKVQEKIKVKGEKTAEDVKQLKTLIKETNENVAQVSKTLNNLAENKDVQESIDKIKKSTENISEFIESGKLKEFNRNVGKFNDKMIEMKDRELKYINEFNESLKTASVKLQKLINSFEQKEEKDKATESNL